MEKKNVICLAEEWRRNNPSPPKNVPKTAPSARRSSSNMKKKTQAQKKVKEKAPATKKYIHGYRIPNIQQDATENVFQMARTMMEMQKRADARLEYRK
ncbi:hypothetical protein O181_128884 [Austropuccinia psidii MF-1]|uniref:Uncharacterized protein n=1 Tax=Austropuccinia psidii MF-1 TaxID=1389203 RepID=A0A9Q3KY26_9BASI|nr:hypothetical protein [Austropuccinia psidii MF-1]